jgi:hypothetical protein
VWHGVDCIEAKGLTPSHSSVPVREITALRLRRHLPLVAATISVVLAQAVGTWVMVRHLPGEPPDNSAELEAIIRHLQAIEVDACSIDRRLTPIAERPLSPNAPCPSDAAAPAGEWPWQKEERQNRARDASGQMWYPWPKQKPPSNQR